MTRTSYREQDYAFGQRILALRTAMGLAQAALADLLGVSRRAIVGWEAGESYPKPNHLQQFIELAVQQGAFRAGQEAEEIRHLWRAAHQKVLLDEQWLCELLQAIPAPQAPGNEAERAVQVPTASALHTPRTDWDDALDVPNFYGREEEQTLLVEWIVKDQCRVVLVLGMGGIGKSALATTVMHQVAEQFDAVIWRSLRDSPTCETLVDGVIQTLIPHALAEVNIPFERRLERLMEQLRTQRVLLVLDNAEMVLEGARAGELRSGSEAYARLLRHIGETRHQSCLLLTSREKPATLAPLEGHRSPVRAMQLAGLDEGAATQLLDEKHVTCSAAERARLVELYQGNPLALKMVAQTIVDVFGGTIAPFFEQGDVIFGGVRDLLNQQFARLSALEQTVVLWLAVLREPVSLHDLLAVLRVPPTGGQGLEAVESLRRRSLIEQGQRVGTFTLQSVVLEYATARLVDEIRYEVEHGQFVRLLDYGLCQAQAKDYVRQTQEQMLVLPILASLRNIYQGHAEIEAHLLALIDQLRSMMQRAHGYGPANLVTLLRVLKGDLRNLNLSQLTLRGVFLQDTEMQDTSLVNATVQSTIFTEPFDSVMTVAMSSTGHYWAAATRRGEVQVWEQGGQLLRHAWHAHTETVYALTFSPDERVLASASANDIKLWDVDSGALLWQSWLVKSCLWLEFSPRDQMFASAGMDEFVRLWDPQHKTPFRALRHASGVLYVTWSPDGRLLAAGCGDGSIWLWQPEGPQVDTPSNVLTGHTNYILGVAFSPDGERLASASIDGTVKLWDVSTGDCLQTFSEHTAPVRRVQWSRDGGTLASCGYDATIRFWNVQTGRASKVLLGHTGLITNLVFTPDSRVLVSGSYDGTVRVWDVARGQCVRIIQGYTVALVELDWSVDGAQLVSCGDDAVLTLWDATATKPPVALQNPRSSMAEGLGVAWSPDGQLLASVGRDSIGLWNATTGVRLHELNDPDSTGILFHGVAWSPDGQLLAATTPGFGVHVWEITTRTRRWGGQTQRAHNRRVAWSLDGCLLAGGDHNGFIYVWDASDGTQYQRLKGHDGAVMSVAWKPDGKQLVSGGGGEQGELFCVGCAKLETRPSFRRGTLMVSAVVWASSGKLLISGDGAGNVRWWDSERGECLRVKEAHTGMVQALKISPDGSTLASCGDDGAIRLWDVSSGELLRTLRKDRPYERLDITGIRGLSEAQKASLRALGAVENVQVAG